MDRDKHRIEADGLRHDGVSTYPADAHDIQLFEQARQLQAQQRVPVFLHAGNPDERLFVACFDGTGNDAARDPDHKTNIALIGEEIAASYRNGKVAIAAGYVEGPGTQANPMARLYDGATGASYPDRLERMYLQFTRQCRDWLQENPNAQIRLADIGFSRGAEEAALFTRLVGERGIADPDSRMVTRDAHGRESVHYARTLVPPGQVPQVAALIDPVATGSMENVDRRLHESVLSATQYTAEDERRGLFRASLHMPIGFSENGRLLNVWVPGAHSDQGGGYHLDGLSVRTGNLVIDQLNGLSEAPFLQRRPEPDDPRLNVVHRSEAGSALYRAWPKVDRRAADGMVATLASPAQCREFDCHVPMPMDAALSARFERRAVPVPGIAPPSAPDPREAVAGLFERLGAAALYGDLERFRAGSRDYLQSDDAAVIRMQGAAMLESVAMPPPVAAQEAPVHALRGPHR